MSHSKCILNTTLTNLPPTVAPYKSVYKNPAFARTLGEGRFYKNPAYAQYVQI